MFSRNTCFVWQQIGFFWPKSPGGPSDDLGRSFGIILSPKFQNPTMLVNHFHVFFCKIPRWTGGPGPPGSPKIGIFGPKTPGDPSDDLGRSFGIISTPKFQHPTIFVNHFIVLCKDICSKRMKIKLFGHPLDPRALGTPPGCKSAKFCSG